MYFFHLQPVQGLQAGDEHLCFHFLQWMLTQFLCHVLWTDEAVFTRSGVYSIHSLHVWPTENLMLPVTSHSSKD